MANNDDKEPNRLFSIMHATTSLCEFKNGWYSIQEIAKRQTETANDRKIDNTTGGIKDPFDCSGLTLAYIHDQADRIAEDFARRWRTLDHRKIIDGERPQWYQRRVRLPENFRLDQKPVENPDSDERVVNLDNPEETLSYSSELWKLFEKIPSADELELQTFTGQCLPRTAALSVADESQGRKRMRLSQCHDVVPRSNGTFVATIRLECWKNAPTSDSLPDRNRLVLEFSEDQTLLDVHKTLVLMAATNKDKEMNTSNEGFFFIENHFYVSTERTSVQSIIEWLKSEKKRSATLGLDDSCTSAQVKSMADTRIADLHCRFGVRYCHQSSWTFESAIFVTDFRMSNGNHCFPIIHDTWFDSTVNCEACLGQPATLTTATTSALGHRTLCKSCCQSLNIPDIDHKCYTVWDAG